LVCFFYCIILVHVGFFEEPSHVRVLVLVHSNVWHIVAMDSSVLHYQIDGLTKTFVFGA